MRLLGFLSFSRLFSNQMMTSMKNGDHYGNFFCAKFVLPQGIFVPNFMTIAYSNQELGRVHANDANHPFLIKVTPDKKRVICIISMDPT